MRKIEGLFVTERTFRKVQADLAKYDRALLRRGWLFAHRLDPAKFIYLMPVYTPEALAAAKQEGSLVQELAQ